MIVARSSQKFFCGQKRTFARKQKVSGVLGAFFCGVKRQGKAEPAGELACPAVAAKQAKPPPRKAGGES